MTMHNFLPHTDAERQAMLATIGVPHIDALFEDIPASLRERMTFHTLPARGLSEAELQQALQQQAAANTGATMACFLGGGAYWRFIPMAVHNIASRAEFYTAYTPYQPEIAQGTLQMTYEFQTMISELTGMDVANASVYDGASAVTEAALMAMRITKRDTVWISKTVHPDYRAVLKTYLDGLGGVNLVEFHPDTAQERLAQPDTQVACVILQVPNYLGGIEPTETAQAFCQASGALLVVSADPVSLGVLSPPGDYGAAIVTGDIQPLGNALSFGGPYGGYIACKKQYMRQLPGRLVGRTRDKSGIPCYTLTLQTREQHIRREKATSNICTNQALNVLKATVYMTVAGPAGLRDVATISAQRAHELARQLQTIPGVRLLHPNQPFLFEFAICFPLPIATVLAHLESQGILGGIPLSSAETGTSDPALLVACTEMTTPEHLERYISSVRELIAQSSTAAACAPSATATVEATCS